MTLRLQLLLLSLLTLLLPWGGCRYARELESVLREGEQQALLASATTIANALTSAQSPTDIPTADHPSPTSGTESGTNKTQPKQIFRAPFDPASGDIYAYQLRTRPLLDGYADEWGLPPQAFQRIGTTNDKLSARYIAGTDGQHLYLLIEVSDSQVTLEQTADARRPPQERADHLWLVTSAHGGPEQSYLFITSAPGLISARRTTLSEFGERGEQTEPRIQGWWQLDHGGYHLELRIPLSLLGDRVGFEIVDIGDASAQRNETAPLRLGTLDTNRQPRGRLLLPMTPLEHTLEQLLPPDMRATVSDSSGWVLTEAGTLQLNHRYSTDDEAQRPAEWLQTLYRRLLERDENLPTRAQTPGQISGKHVTAALGGGKGAAWFRLPDESRSVLAVAVPIFGGERSGNANRPVGGVLVLEQTGDRLLVLRDRALTRLLNFSLLVSGAAVLAMLGFAAVLGFRLARLKRAAETALSRDGRVNVHIPETGAGDELGDLARSFEVLLNRLNEYTQYLRTLAGKLSHELRTPLTIVRSSMENLEENLKAQTLSEDNRAYLQRAYEGANRLQGILTAMGAATRTEEAIEHAERTVFDLTAVVMSAGQAYAAAFPAQRFTVELPNKPCTFRGAPDLIVQLLDKLIDNAIDFSAPQTSIRIDLLITPTEVTLAVTNEGPPIPEALRERLFEPMFELRRESGSKPHFGLGLYIVRLIAEFHGGEFFAENLPEQSAVRVGVRLPRPPL